MRVVLTLPDRVRNAREGAWIESGATPQTLVSVYDVDRSVRVHGSETGEPLADLEEHAYKRDRRFIVRLVTTLLLALVAGLFLFAQLTSERTASCAADAMLGSESPGAKPGAEK